MVEEKQLDANRIYISETDKSFLVYDRNTGNVHHLNKEENLDSLLEELEKIPEKESVFVKTSDNVFKLNLSTICNLNCDYCFRDKQSHIQTDVEKAKRIIDYIIDEYAPHIWMYSFSVNLTSESLVELNKIREVKQYIDERTRPGFCRKDFKNAKTARRYLACFPSELLGDFNSYDNMDAVVGLLDSFLDRKDLINYFPLPDGMILPEWEAQRYAIYDKLEGYDLREFNLRFLEALFPETILRKPHYAFYICTNGTVFNSEVVDFFREIKLDTVCVSLDGPSSVHNLHRFFCNNTDSHGVIVENIKKYMAAGLKVSVAAVLTADYPYPLQLVEYFKRLGVVSVDMTVVRAGTPGCFDEFSIERLLKGYELLFQRLYEDLLKGDFSLVDLLKDTCVFSGIKLLFMKSRIIKRCKWNEDTIFDDEGDIYPCDYFIGKRKFLRGNISSTELKDVFEDKLLVDNRETCKDCWCKYLCGGTCYYNSFKNMNDISVPDTVECKFNKGIRVLDLWLIQKLLDSGFDLLRLWERLGFTYSRELSFNQKYYLEKAVAFSFRGSLTKLEMELKTLLKVLETNSVNCEEELYISVLRILESNTNKILDVMVLIPVEGESIELPLEDFDCRLLNGVDLGSCITGECLSEDKEVEAVKEKISQVVKNYRIPVSGSFWFKSNLNAFLGYKNQKIKVFIQRMKNVY